MNYAAVAAIIGLMKKLDLRISQLNGKLLVVNNGIEILLRNNYRVINKIQCL